MNTTRESKKWEDLSRLKKNNRKFKSVLVYKKPIRIIYIEVQMSNVKETNKQTNTLGLSSKGSKEERREEGSGAEGCAHGRQAKRNAVLWGPKEAVQWSEQQQ